MEDAVFNSVISFSSFNSFNITGSLKKKQERKKERKKKNLIYEKESARAVFIEVSNSQFSRKKEMHRTVKAKQ